MHAVCSEHAKQPCTAYANSLLLLKVSRRTCHGFCSGSQECDLKGAEANALMLQLPVASFAALSW
jgi:hypothetical protein